MSTLLIMAGGTGGHVFPAIAVAENLRERGIEIVWLGTRSGLEARAVPKAGFDIEWINIRGARGTGLVGWLRAPFLVLAAMMQTVGVVLRRKPRALLGMGGFVSGPGGAVAWLMRRPLLIHEANALAGLTNRLLVRIATRVMTGFPGTFPDCPKEEYVGNPVRSRIAALAPPAERLAKRSGPLRLLVFGGSQGARALNRHVPMIVQRVAVGCSVDVWHQTGAAQLAEVERVYAGFVPGARVDAFIDDMADAYAWADLIVCRAGAMTVAEVSAVGAAAVFVPFPYAVGDHQTANAAYLAQRGAAYLVKEDVIGERLPVIIKTCCEDRTALLDIAEKARALGRPGAAQAVADICLETLNA